MLPLAGAAHSATEHAQLTADQADEQAPDPNERPIPTPRSPLIIGAIAYGILGWMVLVVLLLIAWKLFAH